MDPIFIVTIATKGSPKIVRYVGSEDEAQNTVRNKADQIADRLRKREQQNVYLSKEKHTIKVLLQDVGNLWNGFLREHTSLSYSAVSHIDSCEIDIEECCVVEAPEEDDDHNLLISNVV